MSSILINVLLVFGFSALGFIKFMRIVRRNPAANLDNIHRHLPFLLPVVAVGGTVAIVLIIGGYFHGVRWHMPMWLQLIHTRLVWLIVLPMLAFLVSMTTAAAFRERHRERWKLLPACVLLFCTIFYLQWRDLRPIAHLLSSYAVRGEIVLQTSSSSCAAAAAANIVQQFGMLKSERDMAELFGTTASGTSAARVIRGMRKLGILATDVYRKDCDPFNVTVPAMLFVDHPATGPNSHAVAMMDNTDGLVTIWDPLGGPTRMRPETLLRVWHGFALEFRKE